MKNILLIQSSPRASESYSQRVADSIVNEIKDRNPSTDIVVLAVPMHNFGIPSTLKAWIDHVVRVEGAAMSAIGADKAVATATAHSREILARAA
jgi:FMN-dependent NADH-azoreductase